MPTPSLGEIGIWLRRTAGTGAVPEIETLGFGALWVGVSPSLPEARPFLEQSSTLTVATGILNVWQHDPAGVAAQHSDLQREFGGRFLLGVGIGHPEATGEYAKPLTKMREFFNGLDAADEPVPSDERVAAPRSPALEQFFALAADRLLTFFAYVAHDNPRTRFIVYSRGRFHEIGGPEKFVQDAEAHELAARRHAAGGFEPRFLQVDIAFLVQQP